MHTLPFPFQMLMLPAIAIQVGWYVAVLVFLFKIWRKVKHLPG